MLKAYLGDAKVWMEIADELYERNVPDAGIESCGLAGFPGLNEVNVAAVCAGYAFELLFETLLRADQKEPEGVHPPSRTYARLEQSVQAEVSAIAARHGWARIDEFMDYLDNDLCKPARKYWMRPTNGGPARGRLELSGRGRIDALSHLHGDFVELALRRISEGRAMEDWPGLDWVSEWTLAVRSSASLSSAFGAHFR